MNGWWIVGAAIVAAIAWDASDTRRRDVRMVEALLHAGATPVQAGCIARGQINDGWGSSGICVDALRAPGKPKERAAP